MSARAGAPTVGRMGRELPPGAFPLIALLWELARRAAAKNQRLALPYVPKETRAGQRGPQTQGELVQGFRMQEVTRG